MLFLLNNLYAANKHLFPIQAKNAGRRLEEIRSRICQHKEAIEKVRASHAISMVSGHEEKIGECAQEKIHCDAINQDIGSSRWAQGLNRENSTNGGN